MDDPLLRRRLGIALTRNAPKLTRVDPSPTNPLWAEGLITIGSLATRLDVPGIFAQLTNCHLYSLDEAGRPTQPENGFLLSERPSSVKLAGFKSDDLFRCTGLLKLACDHAIVEAVSSCIGCTPTISRLHAYYAFPSQPDKAMTPYRRDLEDFNCITLFVYLTEVGPEDGPHQFIPYTHRIESLHQYLRSTGKKADLQSLFVKNSRNLATAELERIFEDEIVTVTGPAGFAFLEDTYGLHREIRPSRGARLVFSCLYTGLPLRFADQDLRKYEIGRTISFSEAGLVNPTEIERYMFRYYLSQAV